MYPERSNFWWDGEYNRVVFTKLLFKRLKKKISRVEPCILERLVERGRMLSAADRRCSNSWWGSLRDNCSSSEQLPDTKCNVTWMPNGISLAMMSVACVVQMCPLRWNFESVWLITRWIYKHTRTQANISKFPVQPPKIQAAQAAEAARFSSANRILNCHTCLR